MLWETWMMSSSGLTEANMTKSQLCFSRSTAMRPRYKASFSVLKRVLNKSKCSVWHLMALICNDLGQVESRWGLRQTAWIVLPGAGSDDINTGIASRLLGNFKEKLKINLARMLSTQFYTSPSISVELTWKQLVLDIKCKCDYVVGMFRQRYILTLRRSDQVSTGVIVKRCLAQCRLSTGRRPV